MPSSPRRRTEIMPRATAQRPLARTQRAAALLAIGLAMGSAANPALARDFRSYSPSSLLSPGEVEIQMFHNLYTQTETFNDDGDRTDAGERATYYTGLLSITVGQSGWNPGVDLVLRSVDDGNFIGDGGTRTAWTAVEPRVEFSPFRRFPGLSVETGIRIPIGSELQGRPGEAFLDWDDPFWNTQIFFDLEFSERLFAYLETGTQVRWDQDEDDVQVTTPVKAIFNFIPADSWTLYLPLEAAPDWVAEPRGNYWSQVGLGVKYRPTPILEFETLATMFPFGRNAGAGSTINLGIRWIL